MLSITLCAALLCLSPQQAPADISALLETIRAEAKLPAMGVAVVSTAGLEALGVADDREQKGTNPVTVDDRWHLGSCTKAFTATLCGLLIHEGKLRWDSTVGEVLRKEIAVIDAGWNSVTLEDLLRHRGGVSTDADPNDWRAAWQCRDTPQHCRNAFVASMLARPPAHARGTFAYSNQGYAVAGRMCEVVTGIAWEELMRTRICDPLHIKSVGFGVPSLAPNGAANIKGHDADGAIHDIDNPPVIGPAGTMHMTLADWARFVQFHIRGTPTEAMPIPKSIIDRLHSTLEDDKEQAAMGWVVGQRAWGGRVLTHSGSNTVWFCVAWVAPEKGFGVLVTCNQAGDSATKACDKAAAEAIEWWIKHRPVRIRVDPPIQANPIGR